MKLHRYHFIYQPLMRMMNSLPPSGRWLLLVLKIAAVTLLLGFDISHSMQP